MVLKVFIVIRKEIAVLMNRYGHPHKEVFPVWLVPSCIFELLTVYILKRLYAYSYLDKEHGDNPPGARIEVLKKWSEKEDSKLHR